MQDNRKENVLRDAARLMAVINSHLSETQCQHSIKQIATEAFRIQEYSIKNWYDAFVATRDVNTESKSFTKQRLDEG
jgi:hypothetical protein